ncbi:MAG: gluconolaconase [Acidobacteria bacterium]|nr:MAG: gluconolaconase [Acidobacteriota bacterium]
MLTIIKRLRRRAPFRKPTSHPLLVLAACGLALLLGACVKEAGPRRTSAGWRASVAALAGDGSPGFQDGAARESRFDDPFGLTVARDGSIYVADAGESNRIRKVSPSGEVSTLAGGREGFADGAGAGASFNTPSALATDGEGNIYVADTGNNRVRKISPDGNVTTLAGDGTAGFRDGPASQAEFDAPVGVAVDKDGNAYVADTYNDRVRVVTKDGVVKTIAGVGRPGYADGDALTAALFDTPCAVAAGDAGEVYVADTGNNRLRKITKDGRVTTLPVFTPPAASPLANAQSDGAQKADAPPADAPAGDAEPGGTGDNRNPAATTAPAFELSKPAGLAVTRDGFLYVTELDRARVVQVAPDGAARRVAGLGPGFADGDGETTARFNQPAGIAIAPDGSLLVADSANYLVRRVSPTAQQPAGQSAQTDDARSSVREVLPRIPVENFNNPFPWPLDPQLKRHEVSATMGEVRGAYDSADSRDHLHAGLDVFGVYGQTVRAVLAEKVTSPLADWGFGTLNEGLRVGLITYVHLRVGRDEHDGMLDAAPFIAVRDAGGRVARVRVRRGTRVRVGDALGTINRMYHVHMNLGPPGAEMNPLALPLAGFTDTVAPRIERDGVQLFSESGGRLTVKRGGRLVVRGKVRIVLDAYDRTDGNQSRRRLGLYRVGYQLLLPSGEPAPGFEQPRINVEFNRLPPGNEAPKIAYADSSGITVYGSKETRFLYEVTNTVRDGRAERGLWDTSELPPGDYTLRLVAADFNGNEADEGRDVPVTIERN